MTKLPENIERWTAGRRAALVFSILKNEISVADAAEKHGLTTDELDEWMHRFLEGAESALRSRPRDDEAKRELELSRLKQKIGELVIENDYLRGACRTRGIELERTGSDP